MEFKVYQTTTPYIKFGNSTNTGQRQHPMRVDYDFDDYKLKIDSNPDDINKWLVVNFDNYTDRYSKVVDYAQKETSEKFPNSSIVINPNLTPTSIKVYLPPETTARYLVRNEDKQLWWDEDKIFCGDEEFSASISLKLAMLYHVVGSTIYVVCMYIYGGTLLDNSMRWESDCVFPDYLHDKDKKPDMDLINKYLSDYSCVA